MPGLHFLLKADREMVSYDRSFIHDKQSEQRLKLYGLFCEMVKKLVALCFAGKKNHDSFTVQAVYFDPPAKIFSPESTPTGSGRSGSS